MHFFKALLLTPLALVVPASTAAIQKRATVDVRLFLTSHPFT